MFPVDFCLLPRDTTWPAELRRRRTGENAMTTDSLADILSITFAGNYAADADKFARIDRYIQRPDVIPADKFQADRHASLNGMGEDIADPGADYYAALTAAV